MNTNDGAASSCGDGRLSGYHTNQSQWSAWLAFLTVSVVAFLSLAGFGVHPDDTIDRQSSFRCTPPLVSAFSRSSAFERVSTPAPVGDSEVDVGCRAPAQRRLYVAAGVAILGGLVVVRRRPGRRGAAERDERRGRMVSPTPHSTTT